MKKLLEKFEEFRNTYAGKVIIGILVAGGVAVTLFFIFG